MPRQNPACHGLRRQSEARRRFQTGRFSHQANEANEGDRINHERHEAHENVEQEQSEITENETLLPPLSPVKGSSFFILRSSLKRWASANREIGEPEI